MQPRAAGHRPEECQLVALDRMAWSVGPTGTPDLGGCQLGQAPKYFGNKRWTGRFICCAWSRELGTCEVIVTELATIPWFVLKSSLCHNKVSVGMIQIFFLILYLWLMLWDRRTLLISTESSCIMYNPFAVGSNCSLSKPVISPNVPGSSVCRMKRIRMFFRHTCQT